MYLVLSTNDILVKSATEVYIAKLAIGGVPDRAGIIVPKDCAR
jgi:hypothetical protein